MSQLSDDAINLLLTIQKKALKTQAGRMVTDSLINMWYDVEEDDLGSELKLLINELLVGKYIKAYNGEEGQYKLLPKGENYTRIQTGMVVNSFSNISSSQIANMSNNVKQKLSIEDLDDKTKQQIDELIGALRAEDITRARQIVDGLLISAPALVLQMIQIGLGVGNG